MELPRGALVPLLVATSLIAPGVSIVPKLEPKSHDKFFDHDYPDDNRPAKPETAWQHPYPIVQDSEEYDDDYVKDENSDGGEWKVQQKYDVLRGKLAVEKKLLDAYEKRKMIGDSSNVVEADVSTLEDCQKALDAARAKLAGLTEAQSKAQKDAKDADDSKAAADGEYTMDEKEIEDLKKQIAEQEAVHAEAVKMFDKATAKFTKDSADLKVAAGYLRSVRHSEVDQDGGVYYLTPPPKPVPLPVPAPAPAPVVKPPPRKSGAATAVPTVAALALAAATAIIGAA